MASANTFHLVIASVGETHFNGEAVSATMPGSDGECTILAHHEPFVTTLRPGTIVARTPEGEPQKFAVTDGVVECSDNYVTVLL
jgi:F-type H+-transporting ATPase subunit epsilon